MEIDSDIKNRSEKERKRTTCLWTSKRSRSSEAWERERENFQNSQIHKLKKSERSSMIKIEINKWKIEDFFMREIDRRGVHLGRRDGDERPSWECPWGHACRGSEPSPSVLLSELRTLLLMSSSFLSLSFQTLLSLSLLLSDSGCELQICQIHNRNDGVLLRFFVRPNGLTTGLWSMVYVIG